MQYYPEIDTCLCEKDGDLLEKQKELQLLKEDFGRSKLGVIRYKSRDSTGTTEGSVVTPIRLYPLHCTLYSCTLTSHSHVGSPQR